MILRQPILTWAAAYLLVVGGYTLTAGRYSGTALILLLLAFAVCLVLLRSDFPHAPRASATSTPVLGLLAFGSASAQLLLIFRLVHHTTGPWVVVMRSAAAVGAVVCATYLLGTPRWRYLRVTRLIILFGAATAVGSAIVADSPVPLSSPEAFAASGQSDVAAVLNQGADAFLSGQNPYAQVYAPFDASGHPLTDHYVYAPLTILLTGCAKALLGDARYILIAAHLLFALVLLRLGTGTNSEGCREAELAAAMALFVPRGPYLLEQGWTEPLVALAMALAVLLLCRQRKLAGAVVLGLTAALKQNMALTLLPLLRLRGAILRTLIVWGAGVALVCVPFIAWSPGALWEDTVLFLAKSPPRPELLSIPSAFYHAGVVVPQAAFLAVAVAGIIALLALQPATIAGFVQGTACCMFLLFLMSKWGAINYYYLVGTLLLLRMAILLRTGNEMETSRGMGQ